VAFETDRVAPRHGPDEADHVAFVGTHREQFQDFDYGAVECALGELPNQPDPDKGAAELGALLRRVWSSPGDLATARHNFEAAITQNLPRRGTTRGARAFAELLRWCSYHGRTCDSGFLKFAALSATVDPRLVGGKSYADLAREMRRTKATVSKAARNFRERFGFYHHEWRGAEGRARMKQARLAQRLPGAATAICRRLPSQ